MPAGIACNELPGADEAPFELFPKRGAMIASRPNNAATLSWSSKRMFRIYEPWEVIFGHGHGKAGITNNKHDGTRVYKMFREVLSCKYVAMVE